MTFEYELDYRQIGQTFQEILDADIQDFNDDPTSILDFDSCNLKISGELIIE